MIRALLDEPAAAGLDARPFATEKAEAEDHR